MAEISHGLIEVLSYNLLGGRVENHDKSGLLVL